MRIFENPQNRYRESVGRGDALAVLFLGPLWYFARGLIVPGLIHLVLLAPLIAAMAEGSANAGGAAFFFGFLPLQALAAWAVSGQFATDRLRKGWREVHPS